MAKSVVDKARRALARLKEAGDYPAPTPTDQELGLNFARFSEASSNGGRGGVGFWGRMAGYFGR